MNFSFENIELIIESEINELLKLHSGYCKLKSVDALEQVISVSILGGCAGCPSSLITFYNIIQPILNKHFPTAEITIED